MSNTWSAIESLSTFLAVVVALGLGWQGDRRARKDGRETDRRLQWQADQQAAERESAFLMDRLLQLSDAYTTTIAGSGPELSMARERIPLLLYTLPRGFATLLRRDYDVDLDKEHGEVWHEYADPGTSLASPAPTHWVKRELAANMRQASKATGGLLPSTVRRD